MTQTDPKIISFDPGGTTGYVIHKVVPKNAQKCNGSYHYTDSWTGGQLGPDKHHVDLWKLLTKENPDRVVCERFTYQIRKNQQVDMPGVVLMSRNYIGVIELYCELTHTPLFMQETSVIGLKWVDNEALKLLKIHTPGQVHKNDAARHLVYHVVHTMKRTDSLQALKNRTTK